MAKRSSLRLLAVLVALPLARAFTAPIPHASPKINGVNSHSASSSMMPNTASVSRGIRVWRQNMVSDDGASDTASTLPKRRKRKDGKQFSPPSSTSAESEDDTASPEAPAPAPPKENVVVMQVRDIRDVVSGAPEPSEAAVDDKDGEDDEEDELADDEEWEYYDVDEDGNEIVVEEEREGGRGQDGSIEQLLADARSMRASDANGQSLDGGEESKMKDTVFEVISTIVTIDFFVVIGLLVWFLAGIFCSSVLGNDAVQIAFNMNFERVTQPALGILMIGSVAGALGNKEEEE